MATQRHVRQKAGHRIVALTDGGESIEGTPESFQISLAQTRRQRGQGPVRRRGDGVAYLGDKLAAEPEKPQIAAQRTSHSPDRGRRIMAGLLGDVLDQGRRIDTLKVQGLRAEQRLKEMADETTTVPACLPGQSADITQVIVESTDRCLDLVGCPQPWCPEPILALHQQKLIQGSTNGIRALWCWQRTAAHRKMVCEKMADRLGSDSPLIR
jgi:hypothetical protein